MLWALLLTTALANEPTEFNKDAHSVSWKGHKIRGADPASFEAPCPADFESRKGEAAMCAVDAKHIFLGRIKSADPDKGKFELVTLDRGPIKELGKNHFQMGRTIFYRDLLHDLDNVDFATFDELEEENDTGIDSRRLWASDYRHVYCAGEVMKGIGPRDLAFWPFLSWDCKDLVSTPNNGSVPATGYIRDANAVFLYVDCQLQTKLPDADPSTFNVPSILFPSRARDGAGHLYNCGKKTSRRKPNAE